MPPTRRSRRGGLPPRTPLPVPALPTPLQISGDVARWETYWVKLRRVIAQAKDPDDHVPSLEEFLGESLLARKQRATMPTNWMQTNIDDINGPIRCPFEHISEDPPMNYVYALKGTRGVHVCSQCFPYEIRFFGQPDRPLLDALLKKG